MIYLFEADTMLDYRWLGLLEDTELVCWIQSQQSRPLRICGVMNIRFIG